MFSISDGIFSVAQLNVIRDAHVAWCAEHSIEPQSPVGLETMRLMIGAYRQGATHVSGLVAACDRYVEERGEHVGIGSPVIDSKSDADS